jgi:hypothetical protein
VRGLSLRTAPLPGARYDGPASVDQLLGCLSGECGRPADWSGVADTADRYELAPLLFKRLKQGEARARVPADVWERLRLAYFASAGKNVRLHRGLQPVLAGLRSAGIPVIALKGAYLADAVYGDVAVRPMSDVDLMVPRAEAARAQATLVQIGGILASGDGERWCGRRAHLSPVVIRGLPFEVHWAIIDPAEAVSVDTAGIWSRARPALVARVNVLALSREDLLLHLCLHACRREGLQAGLRPFCDISETISRFGNDIDWVQVSGRAHEWGAVRYVGLTLHLARVMLNARVPDGVLESLVPDGFDRRILTAARESVLGRTDYRKQARLIERLDAMSLGRKAKLSRERVFLSREAMAARYPASRGARHLGFYYLLRLRDVLRAFGVLMLRRGLPLVRHRTQDPAVSLANWLKSGRS